MDVSGAQVLDFFQLDIVKQRLDREGRPLGRALAEKDMDRTLPSVV